MPTEAYAKTWGSTKPFLQKYIVPAPEPSPAPEPESESKPKPVLSTKSLEFAFDRITDPEEVKPLKSAIQSSPNPYTKTGAPLWLVILLGVGCGLFFLWAVVATIGARHTQQLHTKMLHNLLIIASKYVSKSIGAAAAPVPTPQQFNLEELLKSLQQ